ncbi:hypothetical protein [Flammeovirga kamogawensis]|uniref:Uncharacterized protein n=1 Tax=Flammeovirga kamogawensis TaxID=373891 RepID=A0ABX8GX44_9BACT|nr:hypothetical protein [Flammeovirga kamogawensis]MBB6461121.1 hypothetical protein [Flammeovirga kamogawensis]QWG07687.1 hypothetical protein KM029_01755 [Flammeovirga kamogawensis]TRX69496.1 hypothetical protein EO216_15695 [Flammeovirga kamogawensis]
MKSLYILTFAVLLTAPKIATAQITTNTNLYELVDPNQQNVDLLYGKKAQTFKGTPFYTNEWEVGHVTLIDGSSFQNVLIKFNAYSDELWSMKDEKNIIVVNKKEVRSFGWKSDEEGELLFEQIKIENKKQYAEVIFTDDKFHLYKVRKKKFNKKDDSASNSYSEAKDEFAWKKPQLFLLSDGKLKEISTKEKEFYSIFGDKKSEVHKFAKSNKLKTKNKSDLEEIFAFYRTL